MKPVACAECGKPVLSGKLCVGCIDKKLDIPAELKRRR